MHQPDSRLSRPGIAAASLVALMIDLVLLAWLMYLTTHGRNTFRTILAAMWLPLVGPIKHLSG